MGFRKPDRQLIVQCLTGTGDSIIRTITNQLEKRAEGKGVKSHTLTFHQGDEEETTRNVELWMRKATKLTAQSRIYLNGHGDWRNQTIGGMFAGEAALFLGMARVPNGIVISITGCEMARDLSSPNYGAIGNSVDSFASNLHRRLKEEHGVETIVFARVAKTMTGTKGTTEGVKITYDADPDSWPGHLRPPVTYHGERTKVCFWWKDGKQARGWWNYKQSGLNMIGWAD
jgi:hypothetical protein